MKRIALLLPLLLLCLGIASLVGCGPSLSGKYRVENMGIRFGSIEFVEGNKVYVSHMGATTQGTYKIEGERIIVSAGTSNLVLTLGENGEITGHPLGTLVKE